MAETIAVLSLKGGTGKTTTVRTLADVLRRVGLDSSSRMRVMHGPVVSTMYSHSSRASRRISLVKRKPSATTCRRWWIRPARRAW